MKKRIEDKALFDVEIPINKEVQTVTKWEEILEYDTREYILKQKRVWIFLNIFSKKKYNRN